MSNRPYKRAETAVVSTELENFFHNRAIFALQLARQARSGNQVGMLFNVHSEQAGAVGLGCAGYCSLETRERDGKSPARQLDALRDLGNHAYLCIFVAPPRHQQNTLLITDIQRKGYRHSREDRR